MKRIFIFAVLALFSTVVFAQSKEEQAIRQVLNDIADAIKTKNASALNRLWANDHMFTNVTGTVYNKTQRISNLNSAPVFEYFTYENPKTRIYGNTAVVNATVKLKSAGADTTTVSTTQVLVKNGGQWQVVNAQGTTGTVPVSDEERNIKQLEQELTDAVIRGDVYMFERYLSDKYIFTAPDGMVQDKAKLIADLKSGDLKIESSIISDMKVLVYGITAVANYRTTDKGKFKDHDLSGQYRWTDTFLKQPDGRWQIISGQGTPIAQQ